jgi:hypothetical protein
MLKCSSAFSKLEAYAKNHSRLHKLHCILGDLKKSCNKVLSYWHSAYTVYV